VKSKNLVICDREKGYADAFARYIMQKEELALQVQTCSDLSHVLSIQEQEGIDYLFISSGYPPGDRGQAEAGTVFVLTEDEEDTLLEGETQVYKYQSGDELLAELIRKCSNGENAENTFLKRLRKKQAKIIGIYSPVHRVGKTSYALRLGRKLSEEANVLYLNLETYGGVGGHFQEGGQTLSDVLYYARQEKSNLGLMLTTLVGHKGKLDYIAPIQVSEDIKSVSGEDWLNLIKRLMEESIYEILILDMDEGVRDIYQIFRVCSEIHVLTLRNEISESKLRQFEEELSLLGHEDIRCKLIRRESRL
jgi:ATPases involved in chromosome partitioning